MKYLIERLMRYLQRINRFRPFDVDGIRYLLRHYILFLEDTIENGEVVRRPEVKYNFFLHNFVNPDPDRHLHNHPWNYATFILWGGYWEEVFVDEMKTKTRLIWRGRFHFRINKGDYHQVKTLSTDGCYTLFFRGSKRKEGWGFWVNGKHIDHDEYFAREHEYIKEHRDGKSGN